MGALEDARARALRSIKLKAAAANSASASPHGASTGQASVVASASTASVDDATAVASASEISPAAAPTGSGPRKPRKRRFLDAPPEDAAVIYAAAAAEPVLRSTPMQSVAAAIPATAAALAPASMQPSFASAAAAPLSSSVVAAADAPMSSADSRPATPPASVDSAGSLVAAAAAANAPTADVAATTAPAPVAPTAKRSRWGGAPSAASAAAASAAAAAAAAGASIVAAAPALGTGVAFSSVPLTLQPPSLSSADSPALPAAASAPAVVVADPSTALVPLGGGGAASPSSTSASTSAGPRKTRFSSESVSLSFDHSLLLRYHPPSTLPRNLQLHVVCAGMTTAQADAFLTHYRLETMEAQLRALAAGRPLDEVDPQPFDPLTRQPRARSPSPEPIYDHQGVRTNTRVSRLRLRLLQTQKRLVADTLARNPNGEFTPPRGFRSSAAARLKFEAQRVVPLDLYPDYNFKGVIIGARGDHQKELEKRTGCKIAVRGKGSWSDARPDSVRKHYPDDDAPQYVSIVADTEENLARGIAEVEKLLIPMSDEARRKSLQALAEKNGWLSAPGEEWGVRACRVCGSRDHLMKSCPQRNHGRGYTTAAGVSCRLCGSRSHPTLDCHQAKGMSREALANKLRSGGGGHTSGGQGQMMKDADERVDEEYELFMAELMGEGSSSSDNGGSSALFSSVARGSNGAQLALPPTSREEAELVSLQQHQAKTAAPSYREYTPALAQQDLQAQQHQQQLHAHQPPMSVQHNSAWSTTTFAPTAPHAPSPHPPHSYGPLHSNFAPPVHAQYPPTYAHYPLQPPPHYL